MNMNIIVISFLATFKRLFMNATQAYVINRFLSLPRYQTCLSKRIAYTISIMHIPQIIITMSRKNEIEFKLHVIKDCF